MEVTLPYGDQNITLYIPEKNISVDILYPNKYGLKDGRIPQDQLVKTALSSPLGCINPFDRVNVDTRVAIVINDKTRPVPNSILLPSLIAKLMDYGVLEQNITFFIASGTHVPMQPNEYQLILDDQMITKFRISAHNCDDKDNLYEIGMTTRGTPVVVNRSFMDCELKIVVGDIELHHFAGYSGGVKSAAIGLCGRQTINKNHALLLDHRATIGNYQDNPLRQDIEEIGKLIGVDYALNAVLNENKEILQVFFGEPLSVMKEGIKLVNELCQVHVESLYDLVIASAGGYPKDINLYQSQKAMTHAARFCRQDGAIFLLAECREGVGSQGYLNYMKNLPSPQQVIDKFSNDGFSVGPHKAYQVARILEKCKVFLRSSMDDSLVRGLLLSPLPHQNDLTDLIRVHLPNPKRIAILPYATACIPALPGGSNE